MSNWLFRALAKHYGFSLDTPYNQLPKKARQVLMYGTGGEKIEVEYEREIGSGKYLTSFEGVLVNLERRFRETNSQGMREEYEGYMSSVPCPDCHGMRLKPISLAVTVGGKSLGEVSTYPVRQRAPSFRI